MGSLSLSLCLSVLSYLKVVGSICWRFLRNPTTKPMCKVGFSHLPFSAFLDSLDICRWLMQYNSLDVTFFSFFLFFFPLATSR